MPTLAVLEAKWKVLLTKKLGKATATFVREVTSKHMVWLLIVLGVGILMHELRNLFYRFSPWIIKHSKLILITVNALMIDYYDSMYVIKAITHVIEEALHAVTHGKFPHNVPKLKHFGEPPQFNASEFRQVLKESVVACNEVDTGWLTLEAYTRAHTSKHVCPLLRAATPMGRFGRAVHSVGSPFSFDPSPQGNNCADGDFDETIATSCMIINSGLVIIQIVLPLMIAFFLFRSYIRVIAEAAWLGIQTGLVAVQRSVKGLARRFL